MTGHVGTNNTEKEGKSAIIGKYRRLIKTCKEARIECTSRPTHKHRRYVWRRK